MRFFLVFVIAGISETPSRTGEKHFFFTCGKPAWIGGCFLIRETIIKVKLSRWMKKIHALFLHFSRLFHSIDEPITEKNASIQLYYRIEIAWCRSSFDFHPALPVLLSIYLLKLCKWLGCSRQPFRVIRFYVAKRGVLLRKEIAGLTSGIESIYTHISDSCKWYAIIMFSVN